MSKYKSQSASKKAKEGGLASLREMSEITGVPVTTLNDWSKTRQKTFNILIFGSMKKKEMNNEETSI